MKDVAAAQAGTAAPIRSAGRWSLFGLLNNLSIQIKALAAFAVLLICLLALGANAYITSTKSAEGLRILSNEIEPKLTAFSGVEQRYYGYAPEDFSLCVVGEQWRER